MAPRVRYTIATRSDDRAYVLVMVLMFLVIIQAMVLVTAAVARYTLMSSSSFRTLLNQPDDLSLGEIRVNPMVLGTPEGWDHACFLTEVKVKESGDPLQMQSITWRTIVGEQPYELITDIHLNSLRPYLLVLVDDSESFGWSSGRFYDEQEVYVKRLSGEVCVSVFDLAGRDFIELDGQIYFRGAYGNTKLRAPFADFYGGAMPSSTFYYPLLARLIEETDLCEIALATSSHGLVQAFTHDRAMLAKALDDLHLGTGESKLSEDLHRSLAAFPAECVTDKHVLYVTDGLAVGDGNLPAAIQDFDHDGNPLDCYYEGMGSHCLDDVSAYAASADIKVHTMGPSTDFLLQVAQRGTGAYLPGPETFMRESPFASQVPVMVRNELLSLANTFGHFGPAWLETEGASYYMIDDLTQLAPVAPFTPAGAAASSFVDGTTLYLSTTRDCLLAIDLVTRRLAWAIRGIGGRIWVRDGMILAGPNATGQCVCLLATPELRWTSAGDIVVASGSMAYLARDKHIAGIDMKSGIAMPTFSAAETISALRYDPCQGVLTAGTEDGAIVFLNQDLSCRATVSTGLAEKIIELRSFHYRKRAMVVALSEHHMVGADSAGIRWVASLDTGVPLQALIMDSKLYLTIWEEGSGCGGIDTGTTALRIYDAPTGAMLSQEQLLSGRAFGPLLDLSSGRIIYANSDMAVREIDISALSGVKDSPLGTRYNPL